MTVHRLLKFGLVLCLVASSLSCGGDGMSRPGGVEQPLTSFGQVLTSTSTRLSLHPKEEKKLPVRIQNPGPETWMSAGHYPVTISYKWYRGVQMLPIEGERTVLITPIRPNQSAEATVRVVAPEQTGNYSLRVTLVQEGVAWFMLKSNTFLELPVKVE
jgi:hypothetical protein